MLDLRGHRKTASMLLKQSDQEMGGFWEAWGEGIVREFGINIHTLLYLKWITNRDLLYNSGNSAQCYVAAWRGGHFGGEWIHVVVWRSLSCPSESITTLLVGYTPIQNKTFKMNNTPSYCHREVNSSLKLYALYKVYVYLIVMLKYHDYTILLPLMI